MKILVVDDEPRQRKYIANTIRTIRPRYEVLEARNGYEAMEFVKLNSVDCVITDIKMPIMDGLSFIEAYEKIRNNIKVVILSGYAYFEYARKALKLGALDFILKPVNEAKVAEMICRVEELIEKEIVEIKEKDSLKERLNTALPTYVERQLNKFIKGNLLADEMEEISNLFPDRGSGMVISFGIQRYESSVLEYSNEEMQEIMLNLKYWMKETLDPVGHSISFFMENRRGTMITILIVKKGMDNLSDSILTKLEEFIKTIKTSYGFDSAIGLGNEYVDIFAEVCNSFNQALFALNSSFFTGAGKAIPYYSVKLVTNRQLFIRFAQEDELNRAVQQLDFDSALKAVHDILDRLVDVNGFDPVYLKDMTVRIFLGLLQANQSLFADEILNTLAQEIKKKVDECETYTELKLETHEFVTLIFLKLQECNSSKGEKLIQKCKKYIEENYMKDISRETLAEIFCFNSSYFSIFFKNKTGMNFSEYLTKVRMKKAHELLRDNKMKIFEIASLIGYNDVKYFCRVFKKEFGKTPDEFRRLKNNEGE